LRIGPLQARCRLNRGYNLYWFILCCCTLAFDDLYFVGLMFVDLVLC